MTFPASYDLPIVPITALDFIAPVKSLDNIPSEYHAYFNNLARRANASLIASYQDESDEGVDL